MYFANMYCYGLDKDCVGITPIETCMGVIFASAGRFLYGVHIPDNGIETNKKGAKAFADFVLNNETVQKKSGKLYLFVNGIQHSTAEEEAKYLRGELKKPDTWVYRVQNIKSGQSIAIMVEQGINALKMEYKIISHPVGWKVGGSKESGQYQAKSAYQGATVPEDLVTGWVNLDKKSCTIKKI
jgi:hypothetical protein